MSEIIKKIQLPTTEGVREIDLEAPLRPMQAQIDELNKDLEVDFVPLMEAWTHSGYYGSRFTEDENGERCLCGTGNLWLHIGRLCGEFEFKLRGRYIKTLYICEGKNITERVELEITRDSDIKEYTYTLNLDFKDAWLYATDSYTYGSVYVYGCSLKKKSNLQRINEASQLHFVTLSTRIEEEKSERLRTESWIGTLSDFRNRPDLCLTYPGRVVMAFDNNGVAEAYYGPYMVYPITRNLQFNIRANCEGRIAKPSNTTVYAFNDNGSCTTSVNLYWPRFYKELFCRCNFERISELELTVDPYYCDSFRELFGRVQLEKPTTITIKGVSGITKAMDCSNMFYKSSKLENVTFDKKFKVANASYMFTESSVRVAHFDKLDLSECTNMRSMYEHTKIAELNMENINLPVCEYLLDICSSTPVTSVNMRNLNAPLAKSFHVLWCKELESIDLTGATFSLNQFYIEGCTKLTSIKYDTPISIDVDINAWGFMLGNLPLIEDPEITYSCLSGYIQLYGTPLSNAAIMKIFNVLKDTEGNNSRITLAAVTYDGLSEEQMAVATSRGYTVLRSTSK